MSGRFGELLLILLIVFVLFGAGKLPHVMRELGRSMKYLRTKKSTSDTSESCILDKANNSVETKNCNAKSIINNNKLNI